jgi:hypothetical protein
MNADGLIYVAIGDRVSCRLTVLKDCNLNEELILQGSPCLILWGSRESLLVSSGNTLYLVSGSEAKPVLRCVR